MFPVPSKKTVITIASTLIVLALITWGIFALVEFMSWRNVTFTLSSGTKSVTLYDASYATDNPDAAKSVASLDGSGTLRLKDGTYYVVPKGDTISSDAISVVINSNNTEINIDPYYSEDHLKQAFTGELSSITSTIQQKYKNIISQYDIKTGTFYHFGNWYSTTLQKNTVEQGEGVDVYGIILRKENGVWNIVAPPKLVFAYKDYRSIPADVLYAANQSIGTF